MQRRVDEFLRLKEPAFVTAYRQAGFRLVSPADLAYEAGDSDQAA
jgi:hypothetical protein